MQRKRPHLIEGAAFLVGYRWYCVGPLATEDVKGDLGSHKKYFPMCHMNRGKPSEALGGD
ncbi:hypothetical protein N9C08_00125 [Rubripirellula sp.]|jgi:hypothetical protein|nr:hypothetical protein [Rubripirellula sp.]MDA9840216.1 hypothetical protein [Rubripirellula sp.]